MEHKEMMLKMHMTYPSLARSSILKQPNGTVSENDK